MTTQSAAAIQTADAAELTESIKALPPLPSVAQEILERFGDEFIDGNQVADIVGKDPAISARLIALANSAYFGLPTPTSDMRDVVNRVLGPDTVRSLSFALASERTFSLGACEAFDSRVFWQRAVSAASSARRIASVVDDLSNEARSFAYVAGLCHSLGVLVMACSYPEQTSEAFRAAEPVMGGIDKELEASFGVSIAKVTHALAKHWDMPEVIVSAYAKRASGDATTDMLAVVINAAVKAARHVEQLESEEAVEHLHAGLKEELPGLSTEHIKAVAFPSERDRETDAQTVDAMAPRSRS